MAPKKKGFSASSVDLAVLVELNTDVLRLRWAELFGLEPVKRASRELLIRAVAYRLQEEAEGGAAKETQRQLDRLSKEFRAFGTINVDPARHIRFGTRIIREWQGRVHEVIVLDNGYLWKGARYRSLSQIARLITGTRWSGPRFFGALPKKTGQAERRKASSVLAKSTVAEKSADHADSRAQPTEVVDA